MALKRFRRLIAVTLALALAVSGVTAVHSAAAHDVATVVPMMDSAMSGDCSDCPNVKSGPSACSVFCASAFIVPAEFVVRDVVAVESPGYFRLQILANRNNPPEPHPPKEC